MAMTNEQNRNNQAELSISRSVSMCCLKLTLIRSSERFLCFCVLFNKIVHHSACIYSVTSRVNTRKLCHV